MLKAALAVFTFSLLGLAQMKGETYDDGNYLLGSCGISARHDDGKNYGDNLELYRDGVCLGLVRGVSDISRRVCAPHGSTVMQEIRVVVKFLQDHPEKLNLRDTDLIETALAQAFP